MEGSVEVTEQPEEIKKAEEILKSCYFQQDMYTAVSYTHLDVYKRQVWGTTESSMVRRIRS